MHTHSKVSIYVDCHPNTHTLVVIIVGNVVEQFDLEGTAVYVQAISMCNKDDALFAPVSQIVFVLFPNWSFGSTSSAAPFSTELSVQ